MSKLMLVRVFAVLMIGGGFIASVHPQGGGSARFGALTTTTENMPIPVCPPNDPNACHIDKW